MFIDRALLANNLVVCQKNLGRRDKQVAPKNKILFEDFFFNSYIVTAQQYIIS